MQRLAPNVLRLLAKPPRKSNRPSWTISMARDCMKAKGYRIENAEGKTEEEACLSSNSSTQRATSAASSA